jgi:hypothetical protein
MEPFEDGMHSFIVRVWREPREAPDELPLWRGMIEHVMTGRRRYMSDLAEVTEFIRQELDPAHGTGGR